MRRAAAVTAVAAAAIASGGATALAAAGDLDPSFSSDGKVSLLGTSFVPRAVAVQPDSRIVVGGYLCEGSATGDATCRRDGRSSFRLARFTSDGGLDGEFGDGGRVTTAIGNAFSQAYDIQLLGSGGIVAAGRAKYDPDENVDGDERDAMALARYSARGDRLREAVLPVGGFSIIADVAVAQDKLYATGVVDDKMFVARFLLDEDDDTGTDLQPDPSFDGDGWTLAPWQYGVGAGVVPTADGGVVAVGLKGVSGDEAKAALNTFGAVKLTGDGALDQSFGNGGLVEQAIGGLGSFANAAAATPGGGWVAAGAGTSATAAGMGLIGAPGAIAPTWQALVTGPRDAIANDVATMPDGRIVVAGQVGSDAFGSAFGVARLSAAGAVDATFGSAGFATIEWDRYARAMAVAVQADGRVVTAGIGCAEGGAADAQCRGGTAVLLLARQLADPPPPVVTPTPSPTPAPPPVVRDTRRPTARVSGVPKRVRRSALRRKGIELRIRASEPVRLDLRLNGVRRASKRRTVALDRVVLKRLRRDVRVRVRAGRKALARTRAGKLTLRVRLTDAAGNATTITRRLRLR